jgi:hypothetical protein
MPSLEHFENIDAKSVPNLEPELIEDIDVKSMPNLEPELIEDIDVKSMPSLEHVENIDINSLKSVESTKLEHMVESDIILNVDKVMEHSKSKDDKEIDLEKGNQCSSKESSFAMDAEGQGEVAIAIGETLDNCADAINAIVSEIGKSEMMSSSITSFDSALQMSTEVKDDDVSLTAEAECAVLDSVPPAKHDEKHVDAASDAGHTILDSVPTTEQVQESIAKEDDDDWCVLGESHQIQDEMIARAAQLLGSALFSSDYIGSIPNNDNTNDESFLTTESSVPTSVPSIQTEISSTVLSRWDTELRELHQLGFLDDRRNVDTLERLEAANIGVDSTEPVTLQQVVNELLSSEKN